jgi:Nif-specific regulatory protein
MVLLADATVIGAEAIGRLLHDARLPERHPAAPAAAGVAAPHPGAVRDFVRIDSHPADQLRDALARHGGNQSRAAQALGLTLRQFSYRCKKLGLLPGS